MMRDSPEPRLSLAEWLVLCVAAEKPMHGFAIAAQLIPDSALGAVWHVARPQVYRSMERLTALGLVREAGREPSRTGPDRQLCEVHLGRPAAGEGLACPAGSARSGCPVGAHGEARPAGPRR